MRRTRRPTTARPDSTSVGYRLRTAGESSVPAPLHRTRRPLLRRTVGCAMHPPVDRSAVAVIAGASGPSVPCTMQLAQCNCRLRASLTPHPVSMSDYCLPSSPLRRPGDVAHRRRGGVRSLAFGVALMLLVQTWFAPERAPAAEHPAATPSAVHGSTGELRPADPIDADDPSAAPAPAPVPAAAQVPVPAPADGGDAEPQQPTDH